jgi:ABC-type Mn2+/Zn2+ transport system permease subunit
MKTLLDTFKLMAAFVLMVAGWGYIMVVTILPIPNMAAAKFAISTRFLFLLSAYIGTWSVSYMIGSATGGQYEIPNRSKISDRQRTETTH